MKKNTSHEPSLSTKKLSLGKETLRALGQNELEQAAGGIPIRTQLC